MRILALAVLATIIVVSGIWLARDRSVADPVVNTTTTATGNVSSPATTPPVTNAGDDEAPQPADPGADDNDGQATEPAEGAEVAEESLVPMGYTQVDYMTDVPQQAFDAPEQVLEDGKDYVAVIRTSAGDITVDLYESLTPETVNNFVFLALHRYFEDVPFHRVLENFMAQTGDPTGTGMGGPGYQFDDEIVESLTFDSEGILAMANAGPGTNGSQFFITFSPTEWLNGNHTIFGHVIEGLEVLPNITRVDPNQPSAIVLFSGTVADLAEEGVELPADPDTNIAEAIEELLGALPTAGQSFSVAGHRGVSGLVGGESAFGFYRTPDEIEEVIIAVRDL